MGINFLGRAREQGCSPVGRLLRGASKANIKVRIPNMNHRVSISVLTQARVSSQVASWILGQVFA